MFEPGLTIRPNPTPPTTFAGATRYLLMTIDRVRSISDRVHILRCTRAPFICMPAFGGDPHTTILLLPSFFIRWQEVPRSHPRIHQPAFSTSRHRSVKPFSQDERLLPHRTYEVPPTLSGQMGSAWRHLRLSLLGRSYRHHRYAFGCYRPRRDRSARTTSLTSGRRRSRAGRLNDPFREVLPKLS